ncbi:MAG: nucleotidyltransferase family protein [Promethearchaeia archaeon]
MNVLSREKIFKLLKHNKRKLREFYVKRIGLFGSVLRNEQINKSDIDFIVEFIEGKKKTIIILLD